MSGFYCNASPVLQLKKGVVEDVSRKISRAVFDFIMTKKMRMKNEATHLVQLERDSKVDNFNIVSKRSKNTFCH